MFLAHHILIQAGLDLMGSRNIPDVQHRRFPFFFLLLFQLLFVGNPPISLQVCQIHKADIGKSPHIGESSLLGQLVQLILELRVVQHSLIVKLAHSLHGFMHTIIADTDIVGQFKHFPGLALRPPADKTYILILTVGTFSGIGSD